MIDTNSINYGIDKLKGAFEAVQPQIDSLTTEYVQYVVFRQISYSVLCLLGIFISLLLWIPVYKYGKNAKGEFRNWDEVEFLLPTTILAILFLVSTMIFFVNLSDTTLAITFPKMFAIQQIIHR
jgi:hypothetical protein